MPTHDRFNPDQPLPIFLADEPAQQSIGKNRNRTAFSSSVLGAGLWIVAATALVAALLSAEIPARVFARLTASISDVTASLASKPSLQPGADQPTSGTQDAVAVENTAEVRTLPPTASGAPSREEVAAAPEPADQAQTAESESANGSLFSQFEAWAAEREAKARLQPAQPVQETPASVQETPARAVQDTPTEVAKDKAASQRSLHRRRHVRANREARAEMRSAHDRHRVRRAQNPGVAEAPRDIRAQEQVEAVQPPQPPSFLQTLGFGNAPPRP